jgi:hypothetical protein
MSGVTLPPKPDADTGLPRPPKAPLDNSWGTSHRHSTDRATSAPTPPPDQSPTLEWIPRSRKTFWQVAVSCFVILIVVALLKDWGLGWAGVWWVWPAFAVISILAGLAVWSSDDMEAGADWFSYGKSWVKTYELTHLEQKKAWASDSLELKDAAGREVSIKITDIQTNPDLWNLVYNGILHSVHYGGAHVNQRAVERLQLDAHDRLPSTDD